MSKVVELQGFEFPNSMLVFRNTKVDTAMLQEIMLCEDKETTVTVFIESDV